MTVTFEYWGTHEILTRLAAEQNAGLRRFWFDQDFLSHSWLKIHIEMQIKNAGPRYTPEMNIELPLMNTFDWLCRNERAIREILRPLGTFNHEWKRTHNLLTSLNSKLDCSSLARLSEQLVDWRSNLPLDPATPLHLSTLGGLARNARKEADRIEYFLLTHPDAEGYKERAQQYDHLAGHKFSNQIRSLRELQTKLYQIEMVMEDRKAEIADRPQILVHGAAGSGKTHLFCDIARTRLEHSLPTILLLSEQFADEEPWKQIFELTGLHFKNADEFLGALDASAEQRGKRALILLDALNENQGVGLWRKHIFGFLSQVARFPRIAIAISIRHGYEESILGDDEEQWPIRVWHNGFDDVLHDACDRYFKHYELEAPTIPLLHPEFANPLFLKTFCQAIRNSGFTAIPEGLAGISAINEFFLKSLRRPLWGDRFSEIDPNGTRIIKFADSLAARIAESDNQWVSISEAETLVAQHIGTDSVQKTLGTLVSEGLLARDMYFRPDDDREEGIRFGYEKLADHLITKHLLDKHLDRKDVRASFGPKTVLGQLVRVPEDGYFPRGPIDAISVQLPELVGIELLQTLKNGGLTDSHVEAFLDSLIWRSSKAITKHAIALIKRNLRRTEVGIARQIYPTLLHLAAQSDHPLNAELIHEVLMPFEMAERDWRWSLFLHEDWQDEGPTSRIVNWAWTENGHPQVGDDVVELVGVTLTWFLTSSNRFLRDRTTKALVAILQHRIPVLIKLLARFREVNDPYVSERLYAVAYGCALRSTDKEAIDELAEWTLVNVFESSPVPPHLLLRDYAHGIIRTAGLEVSSDAILPPFDSEWPSNLPTLAEMTPFFAHNSPQQLGDRASRIEHSVTGWDWARYIVRTDRWYCQRLTDKLTVDSADGGKQSVAEFVTTLTKRQESLLTDYLKADASKRNRPFLDPEISQLRARFLNGMRKKKQSRFEELIEPLIHSLSHRHYSDHWQAPEFPVGLMQRFVLNWIHKSGWKGEWFDHFDQNVDRHYMRDEHKPERVGKKYQWIAYHEALARLSDNFWFKGDRWEGYDFRGAWQVGRRDIDPTMLIRKTNDPGWSSACAVWWSNFDTNHLNTGCSDEDWLRDNNCIPDFAEVLEVVCPSDSSSWFVLDSITNFQQPLPPGEELSDIERRKVWWFVDAFLVQINEIDTITKWAETRKVDYFDSNSGEFPWYMLYGEYPRDLELFGVEPTVLECGTESVRDPELPVPHRRTAVSYSRDSSSYDCSLDERVVIRLPTPSLIDGLGLSGRKMNGRWYDQDGALIAFDPSVDHVGPATLLVNRDWLLTWLQEQNLTLVWLIRGEKQMIGGDRSHDEWLGHLLFQGAFVLQGQNVSGHMRTWFNEPGVRSDRSP